MDPDALGEKPDHLVELGPLVLGEGLGGEEVDGPAGGVVQDGVEHGQVIAEGFARGRRRYDNDVPTPLEDLPGSPLVRIQPLIALLLEGGEKAGVDAGRVLGVAPFLGRNMLNRRDGVFFEPHLLEGFQGPEEAFFTRHDETSAHPT